MASYGQHSSTIQAAAAAGVRIQHHKHPNTAGGVAWRLLDALTAAGSCLTLSVCWRVCSEGQRPFGIGSKSMGAARLQQAVRPSVFQYHQDPVQQQQAVSYTNLEDFSSRVEIYKGRCVGLPEWQQESINELDRDKRTTPCPGSSNTGGSSPADACRTGVWRQHQPRRIAAAACVPGILLTMVVPA